MTHSAQNRLFPLLTALPLVALLACAQAATPLPAPLVDSPATAPGHETAVLAGGCFWGMQSVYRHVRGVIDVSAGYAGGSAETARYRMVSSGRTGHAESVEITFDPAQVSYGTLLQIYFSVAHDPTQLNRQGPDRGTQYRSAIFYTSEAQRRVAQAYIAQLEQADAFPDPIVTQVVPLQAYYIAEPHHQDYAERHPDEPYIVINDAPKVRNLSRQFPELYLADVKTGDGR
ncbi:MAG: peptide-methionine (S)-S-oxide reductase MsrA [Gammaproteobacteria bacterium]|nr:peptide-methionine (S)-S-oxide reductase MsrA [Gammaproteobacteria bacterium]